MRGRVWLAGLALLAGCAPNLEGWWDIRRASLGRDGQTDRREDAGFVLFDEYGSMQLALSYVIDPVDAELVPDPDPEVVSLATEYEPTPEGEPDLTAYVGSVYLELDVLEWRGRSFALESLPNPDGLVFRLELER